MTTKRHGNYLQELKSRSQKKREMNALQDLGERLVDLPQAKLESLGLDSVIVQAAVMARKLRGAKNDSYRRQLQYIGRLMREIDTAPLQEHFATTDADQEGDIQIFKRLERWRDALLEGDESVLDEIRQAFPQADIPGLRETANKAISEKELNRPAKSARQIFRYLRSLENEAQDEQA
ncbi:MAG: ribosome biogenesis factor YjgA [Desulfocurvibacter africanus]